jgi:hypothetical protein
LIDQPVANERCLRSAWRGDGRGFAAGIPTEFTAGAGGSSRGRPHAEFTEDVAPEKDARGTLQVGRADRESAGRRPADCSNEWVESELTMCYKCEPWRRPSKRHPKSMW